MEPTYSTKRIPNSFYRDLIRKSSLELLLETARLGDYSPLEIRDIGDVLNNCNAYSEFKKIKETTPNFYVEFVNDTSKKLSKEGSTIHPIRILNMLAKALDSLQDIVIMSDEYLSENPNNLDHLIIYTEDEIEKLKEANKKIRPYYVV